MSAQVLCDHCKGPIRTGSNDTRSRLRVLLIDPSHRNESILSSTTRESWDFCSVVCAHFFFNERRAADLPADLHCLRPDRVEW